MFTYFIKKFLIVLLPFVRSLISNPWPFPEIELIRNNHRKGITHLQEPHITWTSPYGNTVDLPITVLYQRFLYPELANAYTSPATNGQNNYSTSDRDDNDYHNPQTTKTTEINGDLIQTALDKLEVIFEKVYVEQNIGNPIPHDNQDYYKYNHY